MRRPKVPLRLPLLGHAEKIKRLKFLFGKILTMLILEPGSMWCWYRQVTVTTDTEYFLNAWPGGECEGRAAFATVSALPSQVSHISKYEQVLGFILKYKQVYRTGPVKI